MTPSFRKPLDIEVRPVVWVLGASRGIGRELALQFAYIGCNVSLSSRSMSNLLSLKKEILKKGGQAEAFMCDIKDERSVHRTCKAISQKFGTIDVLVNSAGITSFRSFRKTEAEDFKKIISINLLGPVNAIRAVLPMMFKRRKGWIVNILSTAATTTFQNSSAYSASKAALHALGDVLREEVRSSNIKITNVIPGATDTAMWPSRLRRKHRSKMMNPKSLAEAIVTLYQLPKDVVVEEITLRPIHGDIK